MHHGGAATMRQIQQPFGRQRPVRLSHGVMVHPQLSCQQPYAGQRLTSRKFSGLDQQTELIQHLPVSWDSAAKRDSKNRLRHELNCTLILYSWLFLYGR